MDENVKRLYDKTGFGSYTGGAGLQAEIKQLVTADPAPRCLRLRLPWSSLLANQAANMRTSLFATYR
ncbi:hypothetical protein [Brevibacillus parabrevis]|uniref:hypothetical protein n=1 Tax=Brevibacillus parabrevis TaxID=54914 RepID=UPI001F6163DD|nr:hypothetical protein [Brevibacillus parabrevis]